MTKLEAFLVLRANPKFEGISDSILRSLLSCISEHEDARFSELQLSGLKRHLTEFVQYYEARVAC